VNFEEAKRLIAGAPRLSVYWRGHLYESGIPDFRSPNGVWARNRMIEYGEFVSSREARIESWHQKLTMWPKCAMHNRIQAISHLRHSSGRGVFAR
jgi:hypothetical protein